jgi:uncharacterized repeat protein (TIGR03803 family)
MTSPAMTTSHPLASSEPQNSPRSAIILLACSVAVLAGLLSPAAQAQTLSVLYTFTGKNGANPQGTLMQDSAGNMYGTTFSGGPGDTPGCYDNDGCGVVFEINAAGAENAVYAFAGRTTGTGPVGGVVRDDQGNLYGVTAGGGNVICLEPYGCGLVFEIEADGQEKVLSTFENLNEGRGSQAGLVRDAAGNLYGTTLFGGRTNNGTVFKVDADGNFTQLYAFSGGADGRWPFDGLTLDSQGNLYGTTEFGGDMSGCSGNGCGVVFKIDRAGRQSVLYSFSGGKDGSEPAATLVGDSEGNFYGTTAFGGNVSCDAPYGCGVVFKLNAAGAETVLHTFQGRTADGWDPVAGVARDSAGNLYGTTYRGGAYGLGTVYEVDAGGHESLLHSFTGGSDGAYPSAGVILDAGGNLYGTAAGGGFVGCFGAGCGVVFKIAP